MISHISIARRSSVGGRVSTIIHLDGLRVSHRGRGSRSTVDGDRMISESLPLHRASGLASQIMLVNTMSWARAGECSKSITATVSITSLHRHVVIVTVSAQRSSSFISSSVFVMMFDGDMPASLDRRGRPPANERLRIVAPGEDRAEDAATSAVSSPGFPGLVASVDPGKRLSARRLGRAWAWAPQPVGPASRKCAASDTEDDLNWAISFG